MKRCLLLTCFLFAVMSLKAQDNLLIGVVRDENQSPLSDVEVYWEGYEDEKVRTDRFGVYKIVKRAAAAIVFNYPGKSRVRTILMDGQNELDIDLVDLGTTAITASRWEQSVYEIPASVVIISRDEIEKNGYITLQEVLESVPGVFTIDHRSESDVTIGIRGFWGPFNRNVMIQVNGVNMLSERQNDFPLNKINVPVEAIDKIEIVRGPMSVIYGAGAFFGVINIITNQSDVDSNGMISTSVGTQNGQRNFLRYGINKDGLKLSFNASTWRRNGFNEDWNDFTTTEKYLEDFESNYDASRLDAQTIYRYRDQSIGGQRYSRRHESLNLSLSYEGFSTNVNYATSNFGFSFVHPGPSQRNDYKSSTINAQFGYKRPTDIGRFDYEVKMSVMSSVVDADYRYFYSDALVFGEDRVSSLRLEANGRYVILDSEKRGSLDLDLIGGLWYSGNLINHSRYDAPEFSTINWFLGLSDNTALNTKAGYAQLNLKKNIGKGILNIVSGGRLEQQESYLVENTFLLTTGGNLTLSGLSDEVEVPSTPLRLIPRLAFIYAFRDSASSNGHYLKAMYGQAFNQVGAAINASQANSFARFSDEIDIQPFLRPERIKTFELGYTYVNRDLNYEINLNLFRNELQDLVTRKISQISGGGFETIRDNGGELTTNGLELILKKSIVQAKLLDQDFSLNTSLDISYQQTEITNDRDIILASVRDTATFSPSFSPALLGNLKLNASLNKVSLGANLNYVGDMKAYLRITDSVPEYIGEDTDDYFRLGLNIRVAGIKLNKKINNDAGSLSFNLRASNVLNKQYRYPTYTINPWADRGMLGRGRQLLFTVGYKF